MTYPEAEQYLLSLTNLPRQEYMTDTRQCVQYLKRLQFFLDLIDNPEKKIPHYIHVTGTSGKGSVCSYLSAILQANGKKTGLYVSPHPTYLRERWQIQQQPMSKKDFVRIIGELKPKLNEYLRQSPYDMVSFFDLTTAIALYYFAEQKVDWAVIEVGCGGRYDATNIIPRPDIGIITNIGLDHTEVLGTTKEKIAYEKVGIIKPGSVFFTAETNPRIRAIITRECNKHQVPLITVKKVKDMITNQSQNQALVVAVANHLQIPAKIIEKGLQNAPQPLRFEIIAKKPLIILDGAHNPDKINNTVLAMMNSKLSWNNLFLIIGFSHDKNIIPMMKSLARLKPTMIISTRQTINPFRKVQDPRVLVKYAKRYAPQSKNYMFLDPREALIWTQNQAKSNDAILITGSIFLSGELRPYLTA